MTSQNVGAMEDSAFEVKYTSRVEDLKDANEEYYAACIAQHSQQEKNAIIKNALVHAGDWDLKKHIKMILNT